MARTLLITGGAGFVGSNLALRLKEWHPESRIIAFDNLRRRGGELNLTRLKQGGVEFVHGDARVLDDFPALEVDTLIDCAAEPSAQAGYGGTSPRYVIDANLMGLINCLEFVRKRGSDLVFLSTSRVYPVAPQNSLLTREDESRFTLLPDQPVAGASEEGISEAFPLEGERSIYGATKLCGELLIQEYAAAYKLRAVVTRFGVIAGPWQMGKVDQGVFSLWMAAHLFGIPLKYMGWGGAGKQVRDMLHIEDLCELVDLQLREPDRFAGRVFNAGGGVPGSLSLLETTQICRELTGKRVPIDSDPANRPADVRVYITDSRQLERHCGWRPRRSAYQIMADIHAWMAAHEATIRPVFTS